MSIFVKLNTVDLFIGFNSLKWMTIRRAVVEYKVEKKILKTSCEVKRVSGKSKKNHNNPNICHQVIIVLKYEYFNSVPINCSTNKNGLQFLKVKRKKN